MKKIIYLAIGVVLCIATIATGTYGLSDRNIEIYQKALGMVEEMEESTFTGYELSQFPVAFYDGDHDYVVTGSAKDYQIAKRKPVMDAFVGTAYYVDNHYEVLMPTVEKFNKMFELLNTVQSASKEAMKDNSFDEMNYGDEEHIATMYHEGFHAYQMTNYEENIVKGLQGKNFGEDGLSEQMIVDSVDNNPDVVKKYEEQLALLKKMVLSDSIDEIKKDLGQYKKLEEERKAMLSSDVLILEEYYEKVEGTAYYVESTAYKMVHTEEEYNAYYIDSVDKFTEGSHKYYNMGMAKCRILDKLIPDWKENYDFSTSLAELLYGQMEH
ncbi:MAG: hypothetical protein IJF03_07445 [Lachnospiraceae bacterium]|nr:hypothetical protein [Lachnospiraceae bacterium]